MNSTPEISDSLQASRARMHERRESDAQLSSLIRSRKLNVTAAWIATGLALSIAYDRFIADVPFSSPGMRPGTIPSLIVIASLTAIAFVHAFAYRRFDVAPRLAIATTSMSWLMIASWAAFSGKWILASVSCFSAIVGVYEQIQWRRAPPFLDKFPPQTSLLSPALFACSALVHGAAAITMYWAFMPDVSDDAYQVTNQWMKSGSESVAAQIDDPKSRAQFQAMCAQHGWKDGIELNSSGLARIEARGDRVWTWIPIKAGDLPMLWRVENGEWKLDEVRELLAR